MVENSLSKHLNFILVDIHQYSLLLWQIIVNVPYFINSSFMSDMEEKSETVWLALLSHDYSIQFVTNVFIKSKPMIWCSNHWLIQERVLSRTCNWQNPAGCLDKCSCLFQLIQIHSVVVYAII